MTNETDNEYKKALADATKQAETQGEATKQQLTDAYNQQARGYEELGNVYKENAAWENEGKADVEKSRKAASEAYDAIMNENRPLTEEEKARQRKRRRNAAIWTAIGDGIASLASVVSAANYGQPFKADKTMTERMRERWKELDDERRDKNNLYLNALGKKHDLLKDAYNQYRAEHRDKTEAKAAGANINIEMGKAGSQLAKEKYGVDKGVGDTKVVNAGKAYDADIKRERMDEAKRQHQESMALAREKFNYAKSQDKADERKNSITVANNDGTEEALYYSNKQKGALLRYAKNLEGQTSPWESPKKEGEYLTLLQTMAANDPAVSRNVRDIIERGKTTSSAMSAEEVASYEMPTK